MGEFYCAIEATLSHLGIHRGGFIQLRKGKSIMNNLKREILLASMEAIRDANEKIWCDAYGWPCETEPVDTETVKKILKDTEINFRPAAGELSPATSKYYGYFRDEILETLIMFSRVIGKGGYPGG